MRAGSTRSFEQGFWRQTARRLRRDPTAMTGLVVVSLLFLTAWLAPVLANNKPLAMRWQGRLVFPAVAELVPFRWFVSYPELRLADFDRLKDDPAAVLAVPPVPHSPFSITMSEKLTAPSARHWLGTDDIGRDLLARIIHGAAVSLQVGFVATAIAGFIGLLAGALSGYYGGWIDALLSRLIEVVQAFPALFLILAVLAFLPPSILYVMIVIGLTGWTSIARYTRGEFLRLKELDFVTAARAIGASDAKLIFRHILPNALAPVLVSLTFGVARAILIEASLSFIGLGAQPPTPSWGGILTRAIEYQEWWLTTFPGIAIFVTLTGYNLLGEGLRDATDPRQARGR